MVNIKYRENTNVVRKRRNSQFVRDTRRFARWQWGFTISPELLTEKELIIFLRIPEVSKSKDYHNVIENLKRMHDLPRVHICGKPLYPLEAIRQWIREKTTTGK